jgi:hypothetical protein
VISPQLHFTAVMKNVSFIVDLGLFRRGTSKNIPCTRHATYEKKGSVERMQLIRNVSKCGWVALLLIVAGWPYC